MSSYIQQQAAHHTLIAAHRGTAGGNIPCNTLAAYEAAIRQGADIVEIDVAVSADNQLFVFHPGCEPFHLRSQKYIKDMTADEVAELRFINFDSAKTDHPVSKLDDVLELLKGRCIVNVDKFWTAMPEISAAIRRHGMVEQVLVKTDIDDTLFDMIEQIAPDIPYMPIVDENAESLERLCGRNIRYVGTEILFRTAESTTANPEYWAELKKDGRLLWGNSLLFNYKRRLADNHTDDEGMFGDPDVGWGWYVDNGFDIIQTDWVLPLRLYLQESGRYYR